MPTSDGDNRDRRRPREAGLALAAGRSSRFVDLVSGAPALSTRVWPASGTRKAVRRVLGRGAAGPRALKQRDRFIWRENDVEVFVAGDDCYYELEVNALGTEYEAFFVWQETLPRGSRFKRPGLDLYRARST